MGSTFAVSDAALRGLQGLMVDGIQLIGECGYLDGAGEADEIALTFGFTPGVESGKFLVVSKENGISMEDLRPPPPSASSNPTSLRGAGQLRCQAPPPYASQDFV